jgi:poly-beta-1,6-N-acetyl-D-glucosamine synthase
MEIVVFSDTGSRRFYSTSKMKKPKLAFGGVRIVGDTFFSRLQSMEFLSLIGTAGATLSFGFPSMCNGANLAVRRDVFHEAGGYASNMHIPSGDDEFLLRKVFQLYPDGIEFISNSDAVVKTSSLKTLREFIHQRVRWAGKWRHATSGGNALLAIFIFCFHFSVLLLPLVAFAGRVDGYTVALIIFAKAAVEWLFLKKIADFVDVSWHWPSFILLQAMYPIYAVFIGFISTFSSFEWKGRRLKSFVISVVKK